MILLNEPNIREVMAFPKTGEGRDLLMQAPSPAAPKTLRELGIDVKQK
jgi:aspartyl-tRNA synthetase